MKKVLIVDDSAFMRVSLKSTLEKHHLQVVGEAENGLKAVEMYKALRPDFVTMDITMPVMTGIEALNAIREFDPKAKVVMISSMGQERMVREAIIRGAVTFVVKPFKEEHLCQTIDKVLA